MFQLLETKIIMATIYYTLSAKSNANKDCEILMKFIHGQLTRRAKTNIFLSLEYWNADKQCVDNIPKSRLLTDKQKKLIDDLNTKNEKLISLKTAVLKCFNEADKSNISSDWLTLTVVKFNFPEKYEPKEAEQEISTLFQFVDNFIKHAHERKDKSTGRTLSKRTTQHYSSTQKHLKGFAKSIGKVDLEFADLDQLFYDGFVAYLQSLSFTQNNVGRHIKTLKMMLNEAVLQGFNTGVYWKSFHAFTEDIDNVYLDEKELQQLKDKDLSETLYLDRARDWFLLLAWSGCRFSDLEKISKTNIKDGFITFRQQKTNNKVTIPLHPVVLEILKKYNYQMPEPITNQRFNEYIKEASKQAKIESIETMTRTVGGKLVTEKFEKWEHVSSHTGRRSFCTNMYKRGLPTLMIMSISGHTTEKSFLKYIKVKQEEHAAMMANKWKEIYN